MRYLRMVTNVIEASNIKKYFPATKGFFRSSSKFVHAVDNVSFKIKQNETLSLVGESGCGKSTLGNLTLRLYEPTEGTLKFSGSNIYELTSEEMRRLRSEMQVIFQDPYASLNPRKTVRQILSQPFLIHTQLTKDEIKGEILNLLEVVGLTPPHQYVDRYPHEFSGGQRQRIGVARALALNPKYIVADEPVSALDLSVRGQILNLLREVQEKFNIAYLFITHDLAVVRSISTSVMVMYLGEIVELADVNNLFLKPMHPYTKALLAATPIPNPEATMKRKILILKGEVPSPIDPPSGCRFHTRCPWAKDICSQAHPELIEVGSGHQVACHSI
jgi:oligopeptide/dipeptide ABC transporter ATP-binding protein